MANERRKKPRLEDLKPGEELCQYCQAKCCRYFALAIDTPETRNDFEFIRWYLMHEGATVFTEDGDWYLMVHAKCQHLQPDNYCSDYQNRPQICRDYKTDDCEYEDFWTYDHYWETPEQVEQYAEAVLPRKKRRGIRSPKQAQLPVPP